MEINGECMNVEDLESVYQEQDWRHPVQFQIWINSILNWVWRAYRGESKISVN